MNEDQNVSSERQYVPAAAAALVALGLQLVGYDITEQQVSDQDIDVLAQTCAHDDEAKRGALKTYIVLLLAVVMHPERWTIERNQLPYYIRCHGASWYRKALESEQRKMRAKAATGAFDLQLGQPKVVLHIEGHLDSSGEQPRVELPIDAESAS